MYEPLGKWCSRSCGWQTLGIIDARLTRDLSAADARAVVDMVAVLVGFVCLKEWGVGQCRITRRRGQAPKKSSTIVGKEKRKKVREGGKSGAEYGARYIKRDTKGPACGEERASTA